MDAATLDRIATHVRKEVRARAGRAFEYPDSARIPEIGWVRENLPATAEDFRAIMEAAGKWDKIETAAILLGKRAGPDFTDRCVVLGLDSDADRALVALWLTPEAKPKGKRKQQHSCVMCGAAATSRANAGWACSNHYDDLS